MISLIAALARNGAIGYHNNLLYWLPDDLRRFKALTTGHTIVMGRRTFESFPKGALPNRRNVVLSRTLTSLPGAEVFPDLDSALRSCAQDEEVFVIGGATLYHQCIGKASRMYLTLVNDEPQEADAYFPPFSIADWEVVSDELHEADERHAHPFRFVEYQRRHGACEDFRNT